MELENQKLAELRDWLLPMIMNGQVKIGKPEDTVMLPVNETGCLINW